MEETTNGEKRLLEFDKTTKEYLSALEKIKGALNNSTNIETLKKVLTEMEDLASNFSAFSDIGTPFIRAKKIIGRKIKEINEIIKNIKDQNLQPPLETKTESMLTEKDWKSFVDTGKISEEILHNIAQRISEGNNTMTPKEISIFSNFNKEIEGILQSKLSKQSPETPAPAPEAPTPVVSGASYADQKGPDGKGEETKNTETATKIYDLEKRIKEIEKEISETEEKIKKTEEEYEKLKEEIETKEKTLNELLEKSVFNIKADIKAEKIRKELAPLYDQRNMLNSEWVRLNDAEMSLRDEKRKNEKLKNELEEIEAIEKDIEEKPFLYYLASKITNKEHSIVKDKTVDLRGKDYIFAKHHFLQDTEVDGEGYFEKTYSGFILIIKNVDSLRRKETDSSTGEEKKWIEYPSEEGIFKITGPNGETIADDISGYSKAIDLYGKVAKEYEERMRAEFDSLPIDEIIEKLKKDILKEPSVVIETPQTTPNTDTNTPTVVPTPEYKTANIFDVEQEKKRINEILDEEERVNGVPFSKEERNARLLELFLSAREDFDKKRIEEKSWIKSPLQKTEAWWKEFEKTKTGKVLKVSANVAFIGASTYLLGNLAHINNFSAGEIFKKVSGRVLGSTTINVVLSSFFPKEALDKLGRKIKGNKISADDKKWKKMLKTVASPENGFSGLGIGMSIGSAFIFGGGLGVAAVGVGGIIARRVLVDYFDKKIKDEEKKMEELAVNVEKMDDLNNRLEEVENKRKEILKKIKSEKRKKMILGSALSIGSGFATMMAMTDVHHPAHGEEKIGVDNTKTEEAGISPENPETSTIESNIKREGLANSIYYDKDSDTIISKTAYWDIKITRDGHMHIINESKEIPEGVNPLKDREMSDDEIKFYEKIGFKINPSGVAPQAAEMLAKAEASGTATITPGVNAEVTTTAEVVKFQNDGIKFESGKGGIQAILDLKKQIAEEYAGDYSKAPKSIQDFMATDATKEAINLGLFKPNQEAESALVGVGSTLKFDEHGNLSLHDTLSNKDSVLIKGADAEVEEYSGKMLDSDKIKTKDDFKFKLPEDPKSFSLGDPYKKGEFHLDGAKLNPEDVLSGNNTHDTVPALGVEDIKTDSGSQIEKLKESIRVKIDAHEKMQLGNMQIRTGTAIGTGYFVNQTRGAGGENYFFDSRFPYLHQMGRTGDVFFRDLSPGENDYLNEYKGFIWRNEYGLNGREMLGVCHFLDKTMEYYAGHGGSEEEWNIVRNMGAKEFLSNTVLSTEHKAINEYLTTLREFVKPRGWWYALTRGESIQEYMARALQKLQAEGRLEEFSKKLKT